MKNFPKLVLILFAMGAVPAFLYAATNAEATTSSKIDTAIRKPYAPSAEEKRLTEADQLYRAGSLDAAIAEYQKIAAKYPENPLVYQNLGQAYIARSDKHETPEDNTADLRSAMESWAAANRPENPDRLGLLERMALVYQNQLLDQEKSAALWKEYIAVAETNGLADGDKLTSALVAGITTTKAGYDPVFEEKMEKVADLLRRGKVSSGNFDAYMWLVRYTDYLIKYRKNYTNARDLSALTVKTFPKLEKEDANAHFYLALADMALKQWEQAIDAWKLSSEIIKGIGKESCYYNIAYCYKMINNIELMNRYYYIGTSLKLINSDNVYGESVLPYLQKTKYIKGESENSFWNRAVINISPLISNTTYYVEDKNIDQVITIYINNELSNYSIK